MVPDKYCIYKKLDKIERQELLHRYLVIHHFCEEILGACKGHQEHKRKALSLNQILQYKIKIGLLRYSELDYKNMLSQKLQEKYYCGYYLANANSSVYQC